MRKLVKEIMKTRKKNLIPVKKKKTRNTCMLRNKVIEILRRGRGLTHTKTRKERRRTKGGSMKERRSGRV